MFFENINVSM